MSGWLPLFIILFAVALVVGPVMWLKPSTRDRRLAALRGDAAKAGLTVQMMPLPAALGEGTAAVYICRWEDRRRLQTGWVLERQRVEHEMHFAGYWDWRNGRVAPRAVWGSLRKMLSELPADACAIIATGNGIGVQWRETSGAAGAEKLQSLLSEFRPDIEEGIRLPRRDQSTGE
ncbi:hypothetical protein [Microbulbifer halophilus]|uniref:Preprotein translocase subunit YajC n=1 Tax=Microbulbifer halophilus TaxID=453963 RepID=A0ABW5EJ71_9GAMM|nr:hypothetical protein [Microbulbifer halophilus]MCW8128518.1 hypothetical protein [Microbulbifer halophilus]